MLSTSEFLASPATALALFLLSFLASLWDKISIGVQYPYIVYSVLHNYSLPTVIQCLIWPQTFGTKMYGMMGLLMPLLVALSIFGYLSGSTFAASRCASSNFYQHAFEILLVSTKSENHKDKTVITTVFKESLYIRMFESLFLIFILFLLYTALAWWCGHEKHVLSHHQILNFKLQYNIVVLL